MVSWDNNDGQGDMRTCQEDGSCENFASASKMAAFSPAVGIVSSAPRPLMRSQLRRSRAAEAPMVAVAAVSFDRSGVVSLLDDMSAVMVSPSYGVWGGYG